MRYVIVIIEIDDHKLYEYKGNFDYYLEKKAEREQIQNAEVDKARNLYRREVVLGSKDAQSPNGEV